MHQEVSVNEFIWNLKRLVKEGFPQGLHITSLESKYKQYFSSFPLPAPSFIPGCTTWEEVFNKSAKFRKSFRLSRRKLILVLPKPELNLAALLRLSCYTQYVAVRQGFRVEGLELEDESGSDEEVDQILLAGLESGCKLGHADQRVEPEAASLIIGLTEEQVQEVGSAGEGESQLEPICESLVSRTSSLGNNDNLQLQPPSLDSGMVREGSHECSASLHLDLVGLNAAVTGQNGTCHEPITIKIEEPATPDPEFEGSDRYVSEPQCRFKVDQAVEETTSFEEVNLKTDEDLECGEETSADQTDHYMIAMLSQLAGIDDSSEDYELELHAESSADESPSTKVRKLNKLPTPAPAPPPPPPSCAPVQNRFTMLQRSHSVSRPPIAPQSYAMHSSFVSLDPPPHSSADRHAPPSPSTIDTSQRRRPDAVHSLSKGGKVGELVGMREESGNCGLSLRSDTKYNPPRHRRQTQSSYSNHHTNYQKQSTNFRYYDSREHKNRSSVVNKLMEMKFPRMKPEMEVEPWQERGRRLWSEVKRNVDRLSVERLREISSRSFPDFQEKLFALRSHFKSGAPDASNEFVNEMRDLLSVFVGLSGSGVEGYEQVRNLRRIHQLKLPKAGECNGARRKFSKTEIDGWCELY